MAHARNTSGGIRGGGVGGSRAGSAWPQQERPPTGGVPAGGLLKLAAPHTSFEMTQSNNWSGYNQGALEKGYALHCRSPAPGRCRRPPRPKAGEAESSATWVGIGGGCLGSPRARSTDETLVQAGTEQDVDCERGKPRYSARYELVPVPSTSVSLAGSHPVTRSPCVDQPERCRKFWGHPPSRNLTTGQSWSTTTPYPVHGWAAPNGSRKHRWRIGTRRRRHHSDAQPRQRALLRRHRERDAGEPHQFRGHATGEREWPGTGHPVRSRCRWDVLRTTARTPPLARRPDRGISSRLNSRST